MRARWRSCASCWALVGLLSVARVVAYGWVDSLYAGPRHRFTYLGFGWVPQPTVGQMRALLAAAGAGLARACCWAGAPGCSAVAFLVAFAWIELIDATTYLNHYWFLTLLGGAGGGGPPRSGAEPRCPPGRGAEHRGAGLGLAAALPGRRGLRVRGAGQAAARLAGAGPAARALAARRVADVPGARPARGLGRPCRTSFAVAGAAVRLPHRARCSCGGAPGSPPGSCWSRSTSALGRCSRSACSRG